MDVETTLGTVSLVDAGDFLMLQRHGLDRYVAPHAIDHRANLLALAERGVDRILAICSSGSLKAEIGVGTLLAPHDFIAPQIGLTLYDDARGHVVPALDAQWRATVVEAWQASAGPELVDGAVYRQTPGPRFETPAEVRMLAEHADIIGMTMASECVIACELGISYAAICAVDNLANGIGDQPLTQEGFRAGVAATREALIPALEAVLPRLV